MFADAQIVFLKKEYCDYKDSIDISYCIDSVY